MAAGTSRDNTPRVGDMLVAVGPPPRVGGKVEVLEAGHHHGHGRWHWNCSLRVLVRITDSPG
jgi:hypothetical protein